MFEKFTRLDAADFRQRYQGTYGHFRRGSKQTLVRLDKVDVDNHVVIFVDKDGLSYDVQADAGDETIGFDFLPPKMSYHNTPSGTCLLRRIPQRQFSRGISERNISIRNMSGQGIQVDFKSLGDIFDHTIPVADALSRAVGKKSFALAERSFALSPQFGVWLDAGKIFCFHDSIGNVATTSSLDGELPSLDIKLDDFSLWGTEVKDALARAYIKGTVS